MADNGEGQEKRKGGKGKLLAILALIGAGHLRHPAQHE